MSAPEQRLADPRKLVVVLQSLAVDAAPPVAYAAVLRDDYDAVVDRLRLVEEELRQAREVAHSRLRDRARLVRRAERAEANLDLLIRRFALVSARSGMRAQALQLAEDCITENVANGEGVDSQPAVLDAIFDALKYEIADEPDDARPGAKSPIQSAPVSPVQEVVWHREQEGRGAIPSDKAGPGWVVHVKFRKDGGWYDYWLPVGVIPEGSIVIGRRVKVERSQSWQDGEATVVGLDGSCRAVRPPSCTNEILGFAE